MVGRALDQGSHLEPAEVGDVLIVTGGSRGIGRATACLAGSRVYSVCVNYQRNQDAARAVVEEIQQLGGNAIEVQADISVESEVVALFEATQQMLGRPTALVNSAARLELQMRVDAMDAARLERMFATNVIGSMLCAREAVRRMSTRAGGTGGSIVNVSSAATRYGSPGEYVDYAATKGAIDVFTLGLAREVAEEGIRVNCVRPGHIYTELHAAGGEPGRGASQGSGSDAARRPTGGGGGGNPVAAVAGGVVRDGRDPRCFRRKVEIMARNATIHLPRS